MSCEPLPEDESDFFDLLRMYFPVFIDIKFVIKNCFAKTTKGGLQELADALKVRQKKKKRCDGFGILGRDVVSSCLFIHSTHFVDLLPSSPSSTSPLVGRENRPPTPSRE